MGNELFFYAWRCVVFHPNALVLQFYKKMKENMRYIPFPFSLILIFLVSWNSQFVRSQDKNYVSPVNLPALFSGNFGELRGEHFHAGLDFRTQGVIGHPVFAVASGYVSRIRVAPDGYGRSLYIAHPDGRTSVYAHLDDFNPGMAQWVLEQQYAQKSFRVDLYPTRHQFPVTSGQQVGKSGNTGSSGGPHLHFELRDTRTQDALNPLVYGFSIPRIDKVPPLLFHLFVYQSGTGNMAEGSILKSAYALTGGNGKYKLASGDTIPVNGQVALGLHGFDQMNNSSNKLGIYALEMWVDNQLISKIEFKRLPFYLARYSLAVRDYEESLRNGSMVYRLHKLPHNKAPIYSTSIFNGYLDFSIPVTREITVKAFDEMGNESSFSFYAKYVDAFKNLDYQGEPYFIRKFTWSEPNFFENTDVQVHLPEAALYEDTRFTFRQTQGSVSAYSDTFFVHDHFTPLHKAFKISIKEKNAPSKYRDKLLVVRTDHRGKTSSLGGQWSGGFVTARSNRFGVFALGIDTVPPIIMPVNFIPGGDLSKRETIEFRVSDDLSGIASYTGYIDNTWVLFEHDPKTSRLFYRFDNRLTYGKLHDARLEVTDAKGNKTLLETTFYR
jgi:murein DD-endopeptidase MepM/ murein hydrolase activator NlpD